MHLFFVTSIYYYYLCSCQQDILQNERINLDDNFKFSFVKEIIKVSVNFIRC